MIQMKKVKKIKSIKNAKRHRLSTHSREQIKIHSYYSYQVDIVTEKGETLTFTITPKRGMYKINKMGEESCSYARVLGDLKVNSRIALYSKERIVEGRIKKITASGPSTDVEPGNNPPIHRPGGH